jgi:hypothetical protein
MKKIAAGKNRKLTMAYGTLTRQIFTTSQRLPMTATIMRAKNDTMGRLPWTKPIGCAGARRRGAPAACDPARAEDIPSASGGFRA